MKSRKWALLTVLTVAFAFTELAAPVALGAPPIPTPGAQEEVVIDPPPPGFNSRPEATNTLRVTNRTPTTITLKWHDRSDFEDGNRLFRHTSREYFVRDAVEVIDLGPLNTSDGWVAYTDTDLSPDTQYCYQVRPYNIHGASYSNIKCVYTRDGNSHAVWRAQVTLSTADVKNADTNDDVSVRLNSRTAEVVPSGNNTWVDYGRDDFERGDEFSYDLDLHGISELGDITQIDISKTGDDGWCIEGLALVINGVEVYNEYFGSTSSSCKWLDNEGRHSRRYVIPHATLRAHPLWSAYNEEKAFVLLAASGIPNAETVSRIESMIGNLLYDIKNAHWGHLSGSAYVEAWKKDDQTIHIDVDLAGDSLWFDPELDIDFDLRFDVLYGEEDDEVELDVTTMNFQPSVDFDWFAETLSFFLPCGPIVSIALDEGIPNCIEYLEDYIAKRIEASWQPIAQHFVVYDPCQPGERLTINVSEFADVTFGCIETPPEGELELRNAVGFSPSRFLALPVPTPFPQDGGVVDPPPPGSNSRPEATNTLRVTNRTPTAITLKWHDRSDIEDGNKVFRHTSQEFFVRDAVEVIDLGPLNTSDGWVEYTDTGVSHDSQYCYRVRPYNVHGASYSNIVCAPCVRKNREEGRFGLPNSPKLAELDNPKSSSDAGSDRITRSDADHLVSTRDELLCALAIAYDGEIIYVDDSANIDLTGLPQIVPAGVTLASGRGLNDSPGARLYTRSNMEEFSPLIHLGGPNVRITGLRIEGPSVTKADPIAIGIKSKEGYDCLNPDNFCLEIDNSELYGWPKAAIEIRGYRKILDALSSAAARRRVANKIHIHDNYIHHNQSKLYQGSSHFGYGVVVYDAYALIEKNVFDFNRHAIAGGGNSGSGYISRHNLVLEGQSDFKNRWWQPALNTHAFDMHREGKKDCCGPAGEFIHIHDNSFQFRKKYQNAPIVPYVPAIKIRGRPETPSIVEKNSFRHDDIDDAVRQTNEKGSLMVINNMTGYDSRGDYGIGDFNGDGKDDLFQAAGRGFYYASGGSFVWRHMLNSGERLSEIGFGDFNGDGRTDLLRALNGRWEISWSGTSEWTHLNNSGIGVERLRFGDFDGNGRTDIFKTSDGRWYVSWDGTSGWKHINNSGYGVDKLGFGDFNGDSRTDVFRTSGGRWYVSWSGTSKWAHINNSGYSLKELAFGDFNGDGRSDVFRSEDGRWYYSSGGTSKWIPLHGADWSLSKIIIADFTGDGRDDIARLKSRRLYVSPGGDEAPYVHNVDFLL